MSGMKRQKERQVKPVPGAGASGAPSGLPEGSEKPRGRVRPRQYTIGGSETAKRQAAVILEVLSGGRGTMEASAMIGVSLARYYVLENRAIEGLVRALEPRPKGKQISAESLIGKLQRDNARLARDLARTQALVRVAERAIGLREKKREAETAGGRRRRRARRNDRAERIVTLLRKEPEMAHSPDSSPSS